MPHIEAERPGELVGIEECWRAAFARYVYVRFTGLRRDLDHYLRGYNYDRVHHGRLTVGRIHRLRCPQVEPR